MFREKFFKLAQSKHLHKLFKPSSEDHLLRIIRVLVKEVMEDTTFI